MRHCCNPRSLTFHHLPPQTAAPCSHTEAPTKSYIGVGARVCIGGRWEDWHLHAAGGVSYPKTFGVGVPWGAGPGTDNEVAPAFVFAASQYNLPAAIWQSAAHEIGHLFGLL